VDYLFKSRLRGRGSLITMVCYELSLIIPMKTYTRLAFRSKSTTQCVGLLEHSYSRRRWIMVIQVNKIKLLFIALQNVHSHMRKEKLTIRWTVLWEVDFLGLLCSNMSNSMAVINSCVERFGLSWWDLIIVRPVTWRERSEELGHMFQRALYNQSRLRTHPQVAFEHA